MNQEQFSEAMIRAEWTFAKTMPQWPHEYTLRKKWDDHNEFERAVAFIRDNGYRETFKPTGHEYTRFDVNDQKYWTITGKPEITILINRAKIDRSAAYDAVAEKYDANYQDMRSLAENTEIMELINYRDGTVLDVGCGTGLFLEYNQVDLDCYLGIDPSQGMLDVLTCKYPDARAIKSTFEAFHSGRKFDLIIGLFGSPSHIDPDALARIPAMTRQGGRWVLMFYGPDYKPALLNALTERPVERPYVGVPGGAMKSLGAFDVLIGP